MTRFTDARLLLTIAGADISGATDIHVTLKQYDTVVDITNVEPTQDGLVVWLSQEETAMFSVPPNVPAPLVQVMVNMIIGGKRVATDIATINLQDNLLEEVL